MSAAPASFAAAVRAIGRWDGLDLDTSAGLAAAAIRAARRYPDLHVAWRAAGFPRIDVTADRPKFSSFEAAAQAELKAANIPRPSRMDEARAAAAAARLYCDLHMDWRSRGFPSPF